MAFSTVGIRLGGGRDGGVEFFLAGQGGGFGFIKLASAFGLGVGVGGLGLGGGQGGGIARAREVSRDNFAMFQLSLAFFKAGIVGIDDKASAVSARCMSIDGIELADHLTGLDFAADVGVGERLDPAAGLALDVDVAVAGDLAVGGDRFSRCDTPFDLVGVLGGGAAGVGGDGSFVVEVA